MKTVLRDSSSHSRIIACKPFLSLLLSLLLAAPKAFAVGPNQSSLLNIQAVVLSDDDGSRRTIISDEQIEKWLVFANRVYAPLGLHLSYSPAFDRLEYKSTLLNSMYGVEDRDWRLERQEGNRIAQSYPGKLTVFFRYGPGKDPTGQGFSSHDYDFIAMPGYSAACHCGHEHIDAFAHELGHYLGLSHTFPRVFSSPAELSSQLSAARDSAAAFDGDGLSDTAADPLLRENECSRISELTVSGRKFVLPRKNIMSYYDERNELTPQQQDRALWMLAWRRLHGMSVPGNNASSTLEAEKLKTAETVNCKLSLQAMQEFGEKLWSGDAHVFVASDDKSRVVWSFPVQRAGRYRLKLFCTQAPDFATVDVYLDSKLLLSKYDMFGPVVLPSGEIDCGVQPLALGEHHLSFLVSGKNQRSSGFKFAFDCMQLLPEP